MSGWKTYIDQLHNLLCRLSVCDGNGVELGPDDGFSRWIELTAKVRASASTIYMIGNGASASMASHMAADVVKNTGIHTQVFSDLSLITAISNDIGYEEVFSVPLTRSAKPGDMLLAISSSGNSANILRAADVVREMNVHIITLSGMKENNSLRTKGDINIYLPAATYGEAESCHAAILHFWMDQINLSGKGAGE
ncbi:MAG: SIS domain-containing protein [Planctomycetes bacterium]|nr:SIS domain-containing protein [Planctomycetota bacterium]